MVFSGKINEHMTLTFITKNGKAEIDRKFIEFFLEIKENDQKQKIIGIINDAKPKVFINKSETIAPEIPKILLFFLIAESY
tara:strand:+ start:652 stop:894 length:243 start_codon:yes stop_codon:yes gene_type:complete